MKTLWPLLLLALLLQPAAAQTPDEAERAGAELERKALGLVREALAEAQSLKLRENRVRVQATAARLLWPRDQKAARAAFKAAADGVAELNADIDPEDPQLYNAAQAVAQLRAELVNAASPFDPNLALDFLRATRPTYAEALDATGYGQPSQEQVLEMSVAANVAAREPQRALELAEESLRDSVSGSVLGVMNQLRSKEPALASKLAADIVHRLRPEDLRSQGEAASVAQQLVALTRTSEKSPTVAVIDGPEAVSVGRLAPDSGPALLDEQTRRELVEKVLTAAASGLSNQGGGHGLFYTLQTLLPELEKSAPARAAALRRKADEMERSINPYQQQMRPYQEVINKGTVEALLDAARKAPAEVRDQLYTQAAWKAFNEGEDPERARQILENVASPQQRAQARREMERRGRWRAVQQGGFAEARQTAARLKSPDERAQALLQIARRAAGAGDKETARQVLEEARGFVETQMRGQPQFVYRLQVANEYVQFDADASFEMLESAVARLDALLDAAEVLDGFGQEAFKDGELRSQGGYFWNDLVNQCAQSSALLAREDFERAAAAVKKFRHPEARTGAELVLAQTLLGGLPPPPPPGNSLRAVAPTVIYIKK